MLSTISLSLIRLPLALPLALLGWFSGGTSSYLFGFLLPSLSSHFGSFAPLALLLASCGYSFSLRSSSPGFRFFPFLRVVRAFMMGVFLAVLALVPSPAVCRLFPLGRPPISSLSSLRLSFYPFGVFRRLRPLPLALALALLFFEFISSVLSACVVISSFAQFLTPCFQIRMFFLPHSVPLRILIFFGGLWLFLFSTRRPLLLGCLVSFRFSGHILLCMWSFPHVLLSLVVPLLGGLF